MRKNTSPWLRQLNTARTTKTLTTDVVTDVVVIGAGIAGVATAFFILKYTDKKVAVVERHKLAHGATGHNAGQIVSYFERGFASLVEEFGAEKARDAQRAIEDAWNLVDEMYTDATMSIPLSRFIGHAGLCSLDQVLLHLKNNFHRRAVGLPVETMRISDHVSFLQQIPAEYEGLYSVVPHHDVLEALETHVKDFVAVLSYQKGCMNSALFTQELFGYLERAYPDRFALYENTPIEKIVLHDNYALLDAGRHTLEAGRVVLCTNGFESITLINKTGLDIDTKYHHLVSGKIGYMSGYLEKMNKAPIAISYFIDPSAKADTSYFYLTRRAYEHEGDTSHNLISIGGPEASLEETATYSHADEYPDEMTDQIDAFVKKIYNHGPHHNIDYVFTWHGLMGYTKNGIRMIGPEPKNPVLLYNLGCNGIGILPSVHGGRVIARHVAEEKLPPSIFDIPTT